MHKTTDSHQEIKGLSLKGIEYNVHQRPPPNLGLLIQLAEGLITCISKTRDQMDSQQTYEQPKLNL